ncbi:sulfurtransferase [Rhodococcus sp. SGAir0479]|uniref:sulfurtransferase n=1 Tax=Rhodococcus sp. SGAir0479 TaxID=2567884 RepID=UPI0010CD58A2|nr:rhodanese-like domain-containing protein [Rhodococcus sp. SGAir0479]QCQ91564.1 sulfurtransferase [Rhodococcus sp. SGAir0479]
MCELSTAELPLIQAEDLARDLGRPSLVVLDVTVDLAPARFDGDYRPESGAGPWRAAHVPGSRHVDLLTSFSDPGTGLHFSRPTRERFAADVAALGISATTDVVVYDRGSMTWAARFWWLLRSVGIDARVLDGGLAHWQACGLPVESGSAVPAPTPGDGGLVHDYRPVWADRADVLAVSEGRAPGTLVCALAPAQFAGTEQSRYSRRGHIPGSRNLSAKSLLDDTGRVRDVAAVRAAADGVLVGASAPVVVYCGGGVSACLAALGLVLAGYDDVRVYDGSLEEWSADASLPLVTAPGGDQ